MNEYVKKNLFICILITFIFTMPASGAGDKLEIRRIALDKKTFRPVDQEKVTLSFEITRTADVNVTFYDSLGRQVRTFHLPNHDSGKAQIVWDGMNNNGKLAAGDVFLYIIEAKKGGDPVVYNPAKKTGGYELRALEYTLDKDTGLIEYVLPKAAMVRIRTGTRDGFYGGSIIDWQPKAAGRHSYNWDGKDSSGLLDMLNNPQLDIRLSCYSLPDNCVIAAGNMPELDRDFVFDKQSRLRRDKLWAVKGKYLHYRHDQRYCQSPKFHVTFPKSGQNAADVILISQISPVRIEIDPDDLTHLLNTKFEVMLFVDGVFLYEMEEGSSPFTYDWDTRVFSRGPHILTVTIIGYDDHIATQSRKVIITD